jgi:hypothetical protein
MPGRGIPLSRLSKADLWSTILLFPALGFAGLAICTTCELAMAPTRDAWIGFTIVGSILWFFAWLCAVGRLEELSRRGLWAPLHAAAHPWRAAAILVTAIGIISATAMFAIRWLNAIVF